MELNSVENFSTQNFRQYFKNIANNHCPYCSSHLHFDDQPDSLYVSCNKNFDHFRISGFKDLETGEILLLYFNDNAEGIMNEKTLKDFQKAIYRTNYKIE